jgi:hypothetical protein
MELGLSAGLADLIDERDWAWALLDGIDSYVCFDGFGMKVAHHAACSTSV